jgi:hypothetical protein
MNLIVLDNFLPYPNVVRTWALKQKFLDCDQMTQETGHKNTWPGLRTSTVDELDIQYANDVLTRISFLAKHYFGVSENMGIRSSFQATRLYDGNSWIHKDDDVHVAGLLYLSPNAPITAGTTLYTEPPHEPLDVVGNVFNRLIMYRADIYHKSTEYFGDSLETARLTQVFFIKGE